MRKKYLILLYLQHDQINLQQTTQNQRDILLWLKTNLNYEAA